MAIQFSCGKCGKVLSAPEDKAGRRAKCPGCGEAVAVPSPVSEIEDYSNDFSEQDDVEDYGAPAPKGKKRTSSCPMCGAQVLASDKRCQACGENLAGGTRRTGRGSVEYADFLRRFAAAFIDGFLLNCIVNLITMPVAVAVGVSAAQENLTPDELNLRLIPVQIGSGLLGLIAQWLYSALMESSAKQGTLGKMALGIKVVDLDGNRISFGQATGRHFGKIPSAMICMVGYLMPLWDAKQQALHDKMAGTLVVKK